MTKRFSYDEAQLSGIYQIKNLINGKIYIGSSRYIKSRLSSHKRDLIRNRHDNSYLQAAWNKYGEATFEFSKLEVVNNFDDLEKREQFWIDWTQCYKRNIGYNLRTIANNNGGISYNIGRKHTLEARLKMSISLKGRIKSEELRKSISERQKGVAPMQATIKAALVTRKKDLWPHEKGSLCKCRECRDKKNIQLSEWRKTRGLIAGRDR